MITATLTGLMAACAAHLVIRHTRAALFAAKERSARPAA
jgi:hypothetical protein